MKVAIFLVVAALALITASEAPKKRLELLDEMAAATPIIILDQEGIERFINKGPRGYQVIVFSGPLYTEHMQQFMPIYDGLQSVAGSYETDLRQRRRSDPTIKREAVFVALNTHREQNVLAQFGITGQLRVFAIPSTQDRSNKAPRIDSSRNLDLGRMSWTPTAFHQWTQRMTGLRFQLEVSLFQIFSNNWQYFIYSIVGALAVTFVAFSIKYRMGPRSPMFWFWACGVLYIAIFGGTHFSILREVPWTMTNPRTQQVTIIHPGRSSQLRMEGLLASGLEFCSGLLLVALVDLYPRLQCRGWLKVLVGYVIAALFFASAFGIYRLHAFKTGS